MNGEKYHCSRNTSFVGRIRKLLFATCRFYHNENVMVNVDDSSSVFPIRTLTNNQSLCDAVHSTKQ